VSRQLVPFKSVTKGHSLGWLDEQLVNPELITQGSRMPAFDLDSNSRKAIIGFLASATADDARLILLARPKPLGPEEAAIEVGKLDFSRYGCVGCHGMELQGGVPNPNSQGAEVPSLLHLSQDYTQPKVVKIIRNGKNPPSADPKQPPPPLYMLSWQKVMTDEDVNRIVAFLWSRQPKKNDAW
jgi:cytochrome c553